MPRVRQPESTASRTKVVRSGTSVKGSTFRNNLCLERVIFNSDGTEHHSCQMTSKYDKDANSWTFNVSVYIEEKNDGKSEWLLGRVGKTYLSWDAAHPHLQGYGAWYKKVMKTKTNPGWCKWWNMSDADMYPSPGASHVGDTATAKPGKRQRKETDRLSAARQDGAIKSQGSIKKSSGHSNDGGIGKTTKPKAAPVGLDSVDSSASDSFNMFIPPPKRQKQRAKGKKKAAKISQKTVKRKAKTAPAPLRKVLPRAIDSDPSTSDNTSRSSLSASPKGPSREVLYNISPDAIDCKSRDYIVEERLFEERNRRLWCVLCDKALTRHPRMASNQIVQDFVVDGFDNFEPKDLERSDDAAHIDIASLSTGKETKDDPPPPEPQEIEVSLRTVPREEYDSPKFITKGCRAKYRTLQVTQSMSDIEFWCLVDAVLQADVSLCQLSGAISGLPEHDLFFLENEPLVKGVSGCLAKHLPAKGKSASWKDYLNGHMALLLVVPQPKSPSNVLNSEAQPSDSRSSSVPSDKTAKKPSKQELSFAAKRSEILTECNDEWTEFFMPYATRLLDDEFIRTRAEITTEDLPENFLRQLITIIKTLHTEKGQILITKAGNSASRLDLTLLPAFCRDKMKSIILKKKKKDKEAPPAPQPVPRHAQPHIPWNMGPPSSFTSPFIGHEREARAHMVPQPVDLVRPPYQETREHLSAQWRLNYSYPQGSSARQHVEMYPPPTPTWQQPPAPVSAGLTSDQSYEPHLGPASDEASWWMA